MKVGLALAGGGVKGAYQIGSYYAFKRCHIKFDGIVGTSIGAANGAILLSHHEKELLDMWYNLNPGKLLEIKDNLINDYSNKDKSNLKKTVTTLKIAQGTLKSHGFTTANIRDLMVKLINVDKVMNSAKDFGLATCNFTKRRPMYVYKEQMTKNNLIDYVLASCSLPIFKLNKVIDDSYYIDGGFYDNCPTQMLIKKNYDIVYEIQIKGVGRTYPHKNSKTKIFTIIPSRETCSMMEMNHDIIVDNINMGYFDTLKYLDKLIGYKYTFEKPLLINYAKLTKNISPFMLKRIYSFFNCHTPKSAILKSLDYVMEKEQYDYNNVYKLRKVIKSIPMNNHFVYKFLKGLSI